jgi:hypothetical protein
MAYKFRAKTTMPWDIHDCQKELKSIKLLASRGFAT